MNYPNLLPTARWRREEEAGRRLGRGTSGAGHPPCETPLAGPADEEHATRLHLPVFKVELVPHAQAEVTPVIP